MPRPVSLVVALLSMVALILAVLTAMAGYKPGFMEDYHVLTLNTSTLGHNLVPTKTTKLKDRSLIPSAISSALNSVESKAASELNDVVGDVADKLAAKLGIKQWYSFHLSDLCEGTYSPNATAEDASKHNITCTNSTTAFHFNITDKLNQELELGPLDLNLADLGWSDDIQDGLNGLKFAFYSMLALYITASVLAFLTLLIAIFAGVKPSRLVAIGAAFFAFWAWFCFTLASAFVTYVVLHGSSIINKYGNDIGAFAYKGGKFLALSWSSSALMFLAFVGSALNILMKDKKKNMNGRQKLNEK